MMKTGIIATIAILCSMTFCYGQSYESRLKEGNAALKKNNFPSAKNFFELAKRELKEGQSRKEIDALLKIANDSLINQLERQKSQALKLAELEKAAKEDALNARQEAEIARDAAIVAKEREKSARIREKKARISEEKAHKAAVATHLVYGADVELKKGVDAYPKARKLAYLALQTTNDTIFPPDTIFPLIRQGFGNVAYKTTVTQLGNKKTRLTRVIRDFACASQHDSCLIVVNEENENKVEVPDELWMISLALKDGVDTLSLKKTGRPIMVLHDDRVSTLVVAPKGNDFLIGTQKGKIYVLSMDGDSILLPEKHHSTIHSLAFSKDGKQFISTDQNGQSSIWGYSNGNAFEIAPIPESKTPVYQAAYSFDMQRIVTRNAKSEVKLWDNKGEEIKNLDQLPVYTYHTAFSPNGKYLFASAADGTVRRFDGKTGKQLEAKKYGAKQTVLNMVFSPDSKRSFLFFEDNRLAICPTDQLHNCTEYKFESSVTAIAQSDSLSYPTLLIGFKDGTAQLMDISEKVLNQKLNRSTDAQTMLLDEHLKRFGNSKYSIKKVAFSYNADYLLTLDEKGTLFICHSPDYIKQQLDNEKPHLTPEEIRQFSLEGLYNEIQKNN